MKKIINLFKPVGMTPLQAIDEFKKKKSEFKNEKISYAGRLDPMAQGVLLLLVGEENKKMKQYMGLDKEYKAKILLGLGTDSLDLLGLASNWMVLEFGEKLNESLIKKTMHAFVGKNIQKLPVYSSYKIKGKPLFYYAREGKLDEIKIPSKEINIKKIMVEDISKIGSMELLGNIKEKIKKIKGDFRQKEIIKKWGEILEGEDEEYLVVDVSIECSSGTYIRVIANDFGERLGCKALLLDLIRVKVGNYDVGESEKLG